MARKKDNDYFQMFVEGVTFSCEAADMLNSDFQNYKPETLSERIDSMHKIEHSADIAKHEMMQKLLKEFITPIDREDIQELAGMIDNVTDSIEDVLLHLYMFNIQSLRGDAVEFAALIVQCCKALKDMMEEFKGFQKSKTIKDKIIEINHLEEVGDKLYREAMHKLHSSSSNAAEMHAWTSIYDRLEHCCDMCEEVSETVERIILTNS